jgi:uracil phosphoribosyltransferase
MVHNLSLHNSVLSEWVRELRDSAVQTDRMRFRRNLERIGEIAAYEISKTLLYKEVEVQTPMGITNSVELDAQPVVATLLRAGIPLHQGLLNYFDKADNAFVAGYRKHHSDGTFEIEQQYITSPGLEGRTLIIADPMLASGSSMVLALETLTADEMPLQIHIVTAIACEVGIAYVLRKYPDVHIWTAAIDEELTARAYIVPGLGDAGDLAYGPKRQG